MQSVKLQAEIKLVPLPDGRQVTSLILTAQTPDAFELLHGMGWGRMDKVDGLQYCHVNTVYPHSMGGGENKGEYVLSMTVNYDPWKQVSVPSHPPV